MEEEDEEEEEVDVVVVVVVVQGGHSVVNNKKSFKIRAMRRNRRRRQRQAGGTSCSHTLVAVSPPPLSSSVALSYSTFRTRLFEQVVEHNNCLGKALKKYFDFDSKGHNSIFAPIFQLATKINEEAKKERQIEQVRKDNTFPLTNNRFCKFITTPHLPASSPPPLALLC